MCLGAVPHQASRYEFASPRQIACVRPLFHSMMIWLAGFARASIAPVHGCALDDVHVRSASAGAFVRGAALRSASLASPFPLCELLHTVCVPEEEFACVPLLLFLDVLVLPSAISLAPGAPAPLEGPPLAPARVASVELIFAFLSPLASKVLAALYERKVDMGRK